MTSLFLDYRSALVDRVPHLSLERLTEIGGQRGRLHAQARQDGLIRLLLSNYEGTRRSWNSGTDYRDSCFPKKTLQKYLKTSGSSHHQKFLTPLFAFHQGQRGYSASAGMGKSYRMLPHIRAVLDDLYQGFAPVRLIGRDGEEVFLKDLAGFPFTPTCMLPGCVPLDAVALHRRIAEVESWQTDTIGRLAKAEILQRLRVLRKWAVSAGGIPNGYSMTSTGRAGPSTEGGPHLIGMSPEVRTLVFAETDLVDFDLKASFWTCLQSVAAHLTIKTPAISDYISHRDQFFLPRWAKLLNMDAAVFKPVATSWLLGAQISPFAKAIRDLNGNPFTISATLRSDDLTVRLQKRIRAEAAKVLNKYAAGLPKGTSGGVLNAVGAEFLGDAEEEGGLHCHLLTGLEQFAMRSIVSHIPTPTAVIFDGVIAPAFPVEHLEDVVRIQSEKTLGFPLRVRIKASPFAEQFERMRSTLRSSLPARETAAA